MNNIQKIEVELQKTEKPLTIVFRHKRKAIKVPISSRNRKLWESYAKLDTWEVVNFVNS